MARLRYSACCRRCCFPPLPYEQPGQLVRFYQQEPNKPATRSYLAAPHFASLREHAASFEVVAALFTDSETGHDLVTGGQAQRIRVLRVTSDYFHTLRSGPVRGPGFDRRDEVGTRRVVLSDGLWRTRFASDVSVVGSVVQLSGEPYEVVGIAPQRFEDPIAGDVDAWVPYLSRDSRECPLRRTTLSAPSVGCEMGSASSRLGRSRSLSRSMKERWPAARLSAVDAVPLQEDLVATARGPLHLLLGAVALVLLVACVNVANLVLARATGRIQEFAVRSALGSGSRRLVRQMLVESLLLAGLGGLTGLALASVTVKGCRPLAATPLPRLDEIGFDPVVLAFAALVTLLTAVASGIAPALRFAHIPPVDVLRQQSRSATGTRAQGRLRNGLAAAQLALALTLLIGAGVLLASVRRLQQVDLGFRVERVLTFDVNLPTIRYDAQPARCVSRDLDSRLRSIPGVTVAGGIWFLQRLAAITAGIPRPRGPLAGTSVRRADGFNMQQRTVSGDIFGALAIPVLAGRHLRRA